MTYIRIPHRKKRPFSDKLAEAPVDDASGRYHLIAMHADDPFDTPTGSLSEPPRAREGQRMILLINPADMARENLNEGDTVSLVSDAGDGVHREIVGLTVTPFNLPDGCLGGYYPEMNVLIPPWYRNEASAAKGVPVRIQR
jgi:anaerobic selenocysteine-containing dehydrogenase